MLPGERKNVPEEIQKASAFSPAEVGMIYLRGVQKLIEEARRFPTGPVIRDSAFVNGSLRRFGFEALSQGASPTDADVNTLLLGPNVRRRLEGIHVPSTPYPPLADSSRNPEIVINEGLPVLPVVRHYHRGLIAASSEIEQHKLAVDILALTIHSDRPSFDRRHPLFSLLQEAATHDLMDADVATPQARLRHIAGELLSEKVLAVRINPDPVDSWIRVINSDIRFDPIPERPVAQTA